MDASKLFGKNSVRSGLAFLWSSFAIFYLVLITVHQIPESNHRIVDTVLGFLLGTIVSGIVGYYFGSSQSSADKTDILANERSPANTTTFKASITNAKVYEDTLTEEAYKLLTDEEKLLYAKEDVSGVITYRKIV